MKNLKPSNNKSNIPDFDVLDLDAPQDDSSEPVLDENVEADDQYPADEYDDNTPKKNGIKRFLNIHFFLLITFIIVIICLVVKFKNWGVFIDQSEIERDDSGKYMDVLDQVLPLVDENGKKVVRDVKNIAIFGNGPFADDRDSADSLANMLAKSTNATVYNCAVANSYLACEHPFFDAGAKPMDAYSFYWLATLGITKVNESYLLNASKELGELTPSDADVVRQTLMDLDFSTLDTIIVMYDATDYLLGHKMYNDENPTDIEFFTGNLEASIQLIKDNYPDIRIIVMSPTYAYGIDDDGKYVSSDIKTYGQDVLSTYVIKEFQSCADRSVTFIDNIYGTITEANATEYLTDNLHLNDEGRKLVLERLLYAINYYND